MTKSLLVYIKTCIQSPYLGPRECGPYTHVIFICRFSNMESIPLGACQMFGLCVSASATLYLFICKLCKLDNDILLWRTHGITILIVYGRAVDVWDRQASIHLLHFTNDSFTANSKVLREAELRHQHLLIHSIHLAVEAFFILRYSQANVRVFL